MGLKESRKRSSKPMGIMRCRKVRMGHSKSEVMKQESKGLVENPWAPKMKNKVIGPGKPKRVSKSPWKCKVRKWAKDAQGCKEKLVWAQAIQAHSLKVDNFYGKIILWGYPRWGNGSLLSLSPITQLNMTNWSFTSLILPLITIISSLVFAISPITCSFYLF